MPVPTLSPALDDALATSGLAQHFDTRGILYEICPACEAARGLKLSLASQRVQCRECGLNGPLLTYLHQRNEMQGDYHDISTRDDTCKQPVNRENHHIPEGKSGSNESGPDKGDGHLSARTNRKQPSKAEIITLNTKPSARHETNPSAGDQKNHLTSRKATTTTSRPGTQPRIPSLACHGHRKGNPGERIIITTLALIFLGAGITATGLSGFANYQAFSAGVSDSLQGTIWGWSGVIAAICSFGGFTFFWWHISSQRHVEGMRTLVFALAGAMTSIAGTSLYMQNNTAMQAAEWQNIQQIQEIRQNQITDWKRQLDAIPPQTRSVAGLEAYLAGVETVGRTHHKPYRDAQNELGLAKRRAALEAKIANTRALVLKQTEQSSHRKPQSMIPAWIFALMLEIFASQGTSIAFVALLVLYGLRNPIAKISRKPDACV